MSRAANLRFEILFWKTRVLTYKWWVFQACFSISLRKICIPQWGINKRKGRIVRRSGFLPQLWVQPVGEASGFWWNQSLKDLRGRFRDLLVHGPYSTEMGLKVWAGGTCLKKQALFQLGSEVASDPRTTSGQIPHAPFLPNRQLFGFSFLTVGCDCFSLLPFSDGLSHVDSSRCPHN